MKIKAAIRSLRLRATPLVLSGMVMAIGVARTYSGGVSFFTALFLVLTAVFLQFVSNLSNELGDSLSGTDTVQREGMQYSLLSGDMSVKDLWILIFLCVGAACLFGLAMIFFSIGTFFSLKSLFFIILGACAIIAAMRYTLGPKPYGYRGLGDLFVFIFFGLVAVCGGYYILTSDPNIFRALLPAVSIGCFSVAVLNVNNIRDMKTDAATRKTMAIRFGENGARIYQTLLIAAGFVTLTIWVAVARRGLLSYAYLLTLPLYAIHLRTVWTRSGKGLDAMVPMVSISTFILSLLTLLG